MAVGAAGRARVDNEGHDADRRLRDIPCVEVQAALPLDIYTWWYGGTNGTVKLLIKTDPGAELCVMHWWLRGKISSEGNVLHTYIHDRWTDKPPLPTWYRP